MLDFSHLFKTETVDLGSFTVTVRELTHGEKTDVQKALFGDLRAGDKSTVQRQLENIKLNPVAFADEMNFRAIESWTLTDAQGNVVPVSREAWNALPPRITEQVEAAIERLNPSLDEDTKSQTRGESSK